MSVRVGKTAKEKKTGSGGRVYNEAEAAEVVKVEVLKSRSVFEDPLEEVVAPAVMRDEYGEDMIQVAEFPAYMARYGSDKFGNLLLTFTVPRAYRAEPMRLPDYTGYMLQARFFVSPGLMPEDAA